MCSCPRPRRSVRAAARADEVHRRIKRDEIDHAEPQVGAVSVRQLDDLGLGLLVTEGDLVPDEGKATARRGIRVRRLNRECDLRALGSANKLHRLVEPHVHEVHGGRIALRHRHDAVGFFELLALHRRSGQQLMTMQYPSSERNSAPMPSNLRFIAMAKFSNCECVM